MQTRKTSFKKKILVFLCLSVVIVCNTLQIAGADEFGDFVVTVYNEESGLPTGEANDILQTSDGYIWMGSYGGLIRYDGSEFKNYSTLKEIGSSSIRSMFEDSKGRLWIGTNDMGVYVYENYKFRKLDGPTNNEFLCIRDFCEDENGRMFCASNSGLAEIVDNSVVPLADEVIGHTLYSCAVDGKGKLWTVSDNNVHVMDLDSHNVENMVFTTADGKTDLSAYCLAADKEGNILIGTSGNVLVKYSSDGVVSYISTNEVNTHNKIRISENGDALVCGLRGFIVIDKDGRCKEFNEGDKAGSVNSAICDYEGNYWLASSSYGVIKYTRGCFDSPNKKAENLSSIAVNVISKQGGNYYVGHDSGLIVYNEKWQTVDSPLVEILDGVRIRHIIAGSDNNIWIASYSDNAVICYDTVTKKDNCL